MNVERPPAAAAEIENLQAEGRSFPPSAAFSAQANATAALYVEADADYEAFWARLARERIDWMKPFEKTLDWQLPFARWFDGGELNISHECLDRNVARGLADKVAYHFIGEPGDTRTLTYGDLLAEVQKAANALKELGIGKGDVVAIYMPMIPELPIAMLACARIGAPHTVVFGGFSAEALADRINDCPGARAHHRRRRLATRQGRGAEGASPTPPWPTPRPSSTSSSSAASAIRCEMKPGRDLWWHDMVERQVADCPADSGRVGAHALPALHLGHHRPSRRASCTRPPATCWGPASATR